MPISLSCKVLARMAALPSIRAVVTAIPTIGLTKVGIPVYSCPVWGSTAAPMRNRRRTLDSVCLTPTILLQPLVHNKERVMKVTRK